MSAEEKSEDKKEIEDEEREKMLNEENQRDSSEGGVTQEPKVDVEKMKKALEESEKEKEKEGKKKIPIGGIRIPGFLRSRSREKNNKDGESEHEDEKDALHDAPAGTPPQTDPDSMDTGQEQTPPSKRLPLKITNPFKKGKEPSEEIAEGDVASKGKKAALLDAIQLPLVSIFPRKNKAQKEAELGPAGLASMETLDDKSADQGEDGMESVKLDVEEKDIEKGDDTANKQDWRERLKFLSKFRLIIGGVLIFAVLLVVIIVIAAAGPRPSMDSDSPEFSQTVTTQAGCGPVSGLMEDGGFAFRGIPFAVPPVGNKRWEKAQLVDGLEDCWSGTLPAYNDTPTCWQLYSNGTMSGSEDCLTLDIFTPSVSYHSPVSVVVLIGSETLLGGSPGQLQPSARLAKKRDVVFVRPNFRLGVFGFLAADPLSKAAYPRTSGNYGLSDILAALKWVNMHIEHFGGDKKTVTVLGHRAGATLVTALLSSREARGLFQHAWLSSGSASFPGRPLHEAENKNAKYLKNLEVCRENMTADCLRAIDAEDLMDAIPDSWKAPVPNLPMPEEEPPHEWLVLDGVILQKHLFEVFANETLPFKVVIGTTAHSEASIELQRKHSDWKALNDEAVESRVRSSALGVNRTLADEALRRYGTEWAGLASMVSDIRTVCPLITMSRRLQKSGGTFFYVVKQARGNPPLADVSADVEVFMSRYKPHSTEEQRYMSAMEKLFYSFVYMGQVLREQEASIVLIGQDTNPSIKYPNCDLWLMHDIVPRYARVD